MIFASSAPLENITEVEYLNQDVHNSYSIIRANEKRISERIKIIAEQECGVLMQVRRTHIKTAFTR